MVITMLDIDIYVANQLMLNTTITILIQVIIIIIINIIVTEITPGHKDEMGIRNIKFINHQNMDQVTKDIDQNH